MPVNTPSSSVNARSLALSILHFTRRGPQVIMIGLSIGMLCVGCLDEPARDELPPYVEEYSEDGGMYQPITPQGGSGYGSGASSGSGAAQPTASGSGAQRDDALPSQRDQHRAEEDEYSWDKTEFEPEFEPELEPEFKQDIEVSDRLVSPSAHVLNRPLKGFMHE